LSEIIAEIALGILGLGWIQGVRFRGIFGVSDKNAGNNVGD
jgi:hypothetical protein